MMGKNVGLLLLLCSGLFCTVVPEHRYTIDPTPICTIYTTNSILNHKQSYQPLYSGSRIRYSTCTGAAWFHDKYFALMNLHGKKITTYKFDPDLLSATFLQEISSPAAQLFHAEHLVFSPDGTLLAVASDHPYAGVRLYRVDPATHLILDSPIFWIDTPQLIHNVRFTYDGNYLALATFNPEGGIYVYRVCYGGKPMLHFVHYEKNNFAGVQAKTINFTRDNKFAIVVYSPNLQTHAHTLGKFLICVYRFDATRGTLEGIIDQHDNAHHFGSIEDVVLLPDDTAIVLSAQGRDALVVYSFDPALGKIGRSYKLIKNPDAQLSFPHGMGISADGNYIAVANYGDDKCTIYRIAKKET